MVKRIFLTSLVITVLVFIAGLMLGWNLDEYRTNKLLKEVKENELATESYLVEQLFIGGLGGDKCISAQPRINMLSSELAELGKIIETYEENKLFSQQEYDYMVRRYFLLEMKTYVLYNSFKNDCGSESDVVLFFYDQNEESKKQGYVLDAVVEKNPASIAVFSINKEFAKDPAIEALKLYYNVTKAPTLIINNERTKEGFVGIGELEGLLL